MNPRYKINKFTFFFLKMGTEIGKNNMKSFQMFYLYFVFNLRQFPFSNKVFFIRNRNSIRIFVMEFEIDNMEVETI